MEALANNIMTREDLLKAGYRFGDYLVQKNPFIKMLAISGSLTNDDYLTHDDIDYFVITERGRIWECFASCLFYGYLYAKQMKKSRTFFCFNYLIDEEYVEDEIQVNGKSAREIINLKVIYGRETYRDILRIKESIADYYPSEYKEKISENDVSPISTRKKGLPFILAKPLFRPVAKFFEMKRKFKYGNHADYTINKIYSNAHTIRSHFHR